MVLSQLIVFNYKVNCYLIKLRFGTGRTDRGGYRSPSAGTSGLKNTVRRVNRNFTILADQLTLSPAIRGRQIIPANLTVALGLTCPSPPDFQTFLRPCHVSISDHNVDIPEEKKSKKIPIQII